VPRSPLIQRRQVCQNCKARPAFVAIFGEKMRFFLCGRWRAAFHVPQGSLFPRKNLASSGSIR
jgi:hypothetical protein